MNKNQKKGSVFRLNISYLSEKKFGRHPVLGKNEKRPMNQSVELQQLKKQVLDLLLQHEKHRGLDCYRIAWQTHQSCGLAHLDILLKFEKPIKKTSGSFNYLLDICPQDLEHFSLEQKQIGQIYITSYSLSRLNKAILEYGQKQDPLTLNTFTPEQSERFLIIAALKKDCYGYLSDKMKQDPYNFDLAEYVDRYQLDKFVNCWSSIKHKLLDIRAAVLARLQLSKPGIRLITPELIRQRLSLDELELFKTHECFQQIVDHLNQISIYGANRPHKTSNLFLHGPKSTGKTALTTELAKLVGYYNLKYQNKYLNRYSNQKYGFIIWNQTKFTDFSHTWILEFLEGVEVPIPMRYNVCKKSDNPLVIMTSNLSLLKHIELRFKQDVELQRMATENLGARITSVYVPIPMFFMQKLLVPAN